MKDQPEREWIRGAGALRNADVAPGLIFRSGTPNSFRARTRFGGLRCIVWPREACGLARSRCLLRFLFAESAARARRRPASATQISRVKRRLAASGWRPLRQFHRSISPGLARCATTADRSLRSGAPRQRISHSNAISGSRAWLAAPIPAPNRNPARGFQMTRSLDAFAFNANANPGIAPNKNFAIIGAADMLIHI
jgi:hypothetical protein